MSKRNTLHPGLLDLDDYAENIDTVHVVSTDVYEQLERGDFTTVGPAIAPASYAVLTISDPQLRDSADGRGKTRTVRVVLDATESPWIVSERLLFQDFGAQSAYVWVIGILIDPLSKTALAFTEGDGLIAREVERLSSIVFGWCGGLLNGKLRPASMSDLSRAERRSLQRIAPTGALLQPHLLELPGERRPARLITTESVTAELKPKPWRAAAEDLIVRWSAVQSGLVVPR